MNKLIVSFVLIIIVLVGGLFATGCSTRIEPGDPDWQAEVRPFRAEAYINRSRLNYIDIGKGEPVIMVHGMTDSSYGWRENYKPLVENGYRVIIIDKPGHGRSAIPDESYVYSVENQAKTVLKLAELLKTGRFHLIGHSLGGGITLFIHQNHPDKLKSAITVNAPIYGPPRRLFLAWPGVKYLISLVPPRLMAERYVKGVFYNKVLVNERMISQYTIPFQKSGFWHMMASLSEDYFSSRFRLMTENYHENSVPLLVIWGKSDEWISTDFPKKFQKDLAGAEMKMLENCGHSPHQECADRVNPIILEFLENSGKTS